MTTPDDVVLARFRTEFSDEAMFDLASAALSRAHPSLQGYVSWFRETMKGPESMDPRYRESLLVGILAVRGSLLPLALHIYWAQMLGVSRRRN